jgi:hypothetical protein
LKPPKLLPFPVPKSPPIGELKQQLPERKRMTLVATFGGASGTILLADSQESTGYAKKSVSKVEVFTSKPYRFAFAGAGNATHIEGITRCLMRESGLRELPDAGTTHSDVEAALKAAVIGYYQQHIWPRAGDKPELELIFLAQPLPVGHTIAFHIADGLVNFCHYESKAIGIGSYLADYLLPKLVGYAQEDGELFAKAVYILKEVKDNIEGCGGESQIHLFKNDGTCDGLQDAEVLEIEKLVVEFNEIMRQGFDAAFDTGAARSSPSDIVQEMDLIRAKYEWILSNRREIGNKAFDEYRKLRRRAK